MVELRLPKPLSRVRFPSPARVPKTGTLSVCFSQAQRAASGRYRPSDVRCRDRLARWGSGWIWEEALAVGLYCAIVAGSFAECVELAANHDGDSDSTASVAGQLWGARLGVGAVAREVVERVDVIEPLLKVCGEWEDRGNGRA